MRLLPEGGDPRPLAGSGLDRVLTEILNTPAAPARSASTPMPARHGSMSTPGSPSRAPGLAGAITARAEAHTIRLALIYALLDGQHDIQTQHLHAALALGDYTQRSARWALGHATGDPLAEQIHAALMRSPDGLTRTQLRDLLNRNPDTHQLDRALATLAEHGKARPHRVLTAGRPAELWTATPPDTSAARAMRAAQP